MTCFKKSIRNDTLRASKSIRFSPSIACRAAASIFDERAASAGARRISLDTDGLNAAEQVARERLFRCRDSSAADALLRAPVERVFGTNVADPLDG
jgi:hypothetical protein